MTKGTGFSHLREIEEACYRVTTLPNIGGNFSFRSRFILPPRQKKYGVYIVSGNSSNSGNLIPQLAYFALLTRNSSNGESGNIRVITVTGPVRRGLPWIAPGYPLSPPWRLIPAPLPGRPASPPVSPPTAIGRSRGAVLRCIPDSCPIFRSRPVPGPPPKNPTPRGPGRRWKQSSGN